MSALIHNMFCSTCIRSPVFLLQYFLPPVHRWFLDHLDRKIEFLAIYGSPSLFIGGLNQNVK